MSARSELFALAGVKPKKGNEDQAFLKKLYDALSAEFDDDPKDKKWKGLSLAAQQWFNDSVDPATAKEDLPELPADEDEDDGDEDEAPAKKAKANGKAKGKRAKATEANDEDEPEADDEDEPKAKKSKGKAAKAEKGAKKAKNNGAGRRRGPPAFSDDQVIKILIKSPHNEGSKIADRFSKLKTGMKVGAARKAGLSLADLKFDVERGNLSIK